MVYVELSSMPPLSPTSTFFTSSTMQQLQLLNMASPKPTFLKLSSCRLCWCWPYRYVHCGCGLSKGQLTVKSTAYDHNFGERDIHYALEYFSKEFKKKYMIDVMSNPKATLRLRRNLSCSRLFLRLKTGYTRKKAKTPLNLLMFFVSTLWKYLETLLRSATRKWTSVKSLPHSSTRRSTRYMSQVTSTEEKYAHLTRRISRVWSRKWLRSKNDLKTRLRQSERAKDVSPILTSAKIEKRRDELIYYASPILTRPKPKPPVIPAGEKEWSWGTYTQASPFILFSVPDILFNIWHIAHHPNSA